MSSPWCADIQFDYYISVITADRPVCYKSQGPKQGFLTLLIICCTAYYTYPAPKHIKYYTQEFKLVGHETMQIVNLCNYVAVVELMQSMNWCGSHD